MADDWVKLTAVSDSYEAELIAGQLQANGIESRSLKGTDAPGAWLTGSQNPFGPIEIYVPSLQLPAARAFVDVTHVPEPGHPRSERSWIIVVAALLVIALAAILVNGALDMLR